MASFDKILFTESQDGRGIAVAATASPGTLIHTADEAGKTDEVWLSAANTSDDDIEVTVQMGDVTSSDDVVETLLAKSGLQLLVAGALLTGGSEVRVHAAAAGINVFGFVNRF